MAYTNPAVSDFKAQFARDFPFGTDPALAVLDTDIAYAFQMTNLGINPDLWPDQGSYTLAYNLLAAHYLVMNIRTSGQGLNAQFAWLHVGKAAGPVAETIAVPQRVLDNPRLAQLSKTGYGALYLELLWPYLQGAVYAVCGTTRP